MRVSLSGLCGVSLSENCVRASLRRLSVGFLFQKTVRACF